MKIYSSSIRNTILAVITVVLIGGCNSWLDIEPENELIKQEFWKTREDVMSVLAAPYDAFRETTIKSFLLGEVRADFVTVAQGEFSEYAQIGRNDISRSNSKVGWGEYYNVINLANTLMYFDDDVAAVDQTFTPELQRAIEAEAIFIRSMAYFHLVRVWKQVPLVMQASISDTSNLYVAKSPEHEIISKVIDDLIHAQELSYKLDFQGTDYFYGRANYYSITALLADIYPEKEIESALLWTQTPALMPISYGLLEKYFPRTYIERTGSNPV